MIQYHCKAVQLKETFSISGQCLGPDLHLHLSFSREGADREGSSGDTVLGQGENKLLVLITNGCRWLITVSVGIFFFLTKQCIKWLFKQVLCANCVSGARLMF